MPQYVYRAVTDKGQIVRNRIEESSKQTVIKKLKHGGLMPIQVTQVGYAAQKVKKKKKNITSIDDIMQSANSSNLMKNGPERKLTWFEKANLKLRETEKITNRDLVIFTQNFYLLKKANFNNIHALTTVCQTTENPKFRAILEDILAGVEAGEYMYTTMEYYSNIFR